MADTQSTTLRNRLANVALVLVISGWLSIAWGAVRQLGDPNPLIPRAELLASRDFSIGMVLAGVIFLAISVWLSGFTFVTARRRATVTLLLFVVPLAGLFARVFSPGR